MPTKEYMRAYRIGKDRSSENRTPKAKARRRDWQAANIDTARACVRASATFRRFGITQKQYDEKLASQNNLCTLCGEAFYGEYLGGGDPVLDHKHEGGKLRDFIHRMCNTALGLFKDDPAICRKAAVYLEKHGEHNV